MNFGDAKIGDRIYIWVTDDLNRQVVPCPPGRKLLAWVVDQILVVGTTILGWKAGEEMPDLTCSPALILVVPLTSEYAKMGMVTTLKYGAHCECELANDQLYLDLPIQISPQEKPCSQCGRNNNIDVSKCWWCETKDPVG